MDDESISSGEPDLVLIRIRVPELNVEKCLQFQKDEVLWEVKQQSLAALPKVADWFRELQESFNYGLFMPPSNGKAGKFLDEERRLSEYPFTGPIGYLELKYKRRVYKMLQMDEKQLKSINSKANHKKFVDHVVNGNVEKVNKMCTKGLDPNFHCADSGETPLSLAAGLKQKPARMLISLVNGGAIVDFRTKDGSTALHRSVVRNNAESLRTLLELGASPNYKDMKGLTPLYMCVMHASDVVICEMLLHDHAIVGAQDLQGWQEVHQACRNGLVTHLEHLLFYGADMNGQNASGNTPLHVCAVNNQESCARTLLFRGADKDALNYAGQTPYQVAVIAANLELGDVIQNHRPEDVVPFKEHPKFNPRRRVSSTASASTSSAFSSPHPGIHHHHNSLSRTCSDASVVFAASQQQQQQLRLESPIVHSLRVVGASGKPPSPSPSDRSLPPFSSGSSVSETSTGSGGSNAIGPGSSSGRGSHGGPEEEQLDSASALAVPISHDPHVDVLSLSSGVGTSSQSGSAGSATTPTETQRSLILPGMHVVCLENHSSGEPGSLHISQGDIIEVTASSDNGMLEGVLRGQSGFFPAHCVQEVRLRNPESLKQSIVMGAARVAGRREVREQQQQQQELHQDQIQMVQQSTGGQRYFATATRCKTKILTGEPRSCVLHKGKRGFGFVLRGAKAASPLMEMIPSEKCPGLQYMDDVDPGGVADMAGILKGDFLLEINGEDVRQASHERVVNLIRKSGDLVSLTVVTISLSPTGNGAEQNLTTTGAGATQPRQYASTLPRKLAGRSMVQPPPPPKRDPATTLSVGRARAKSMVANLAAIEALDRAINEHDSSTSESVTGSVDSVQRMPDLLDTTRSNNTEDPAKSKVYNSVADMKRSKLQSSIKSKSSDDPTSLAPPLHKDYHSTPTLPTEPQEATPKSSELSKSRNLETSRTVVERNAKNARSFAADFEFRPTASVASHVTTDRDDKVGDMRGYFTLPGRHKKMLEEGGSYRAVTRVRPVATSMQRQLANFTTTTSPPPPPDHPPPPPPQCQLVTVGDHHKNSDYAKVIVKSPEREQPRDRDNELSPRSSFKPSDNAKLYASPENVASVVYRATPDDENRVNDTATADFQKKKSPTRANSMPPRPNRPQVLKRTSTEVPATAAAPVATPVETYSINGINYTTYTTFRSPMTPDDPPPGIDERDQEDLTPTADGLLEGPVIPEPDYDQSDPDYGSYNGSECSGSQYNGFRSTSIEETPSRTLEKKKKKSVSFVMNEEVAAKLQQQRSSAKRQQESILKDPHRDRDRQQLQQLEWNRTPLVKEKYMQPIEKIPLARLRFEPIPQQLPQQQPQAPSPRVQFQIVSQQELPVLQKVRVSEEDKIRIEVPPVVPVKTALARSNSSASNAASVSTAAASTKQALHKSQSFCAEKLSAANTMQTVAPVALPSPVDASGPISESDIQKARSQLKPSRSFPNDFKNNNGGNNKKGSNVVTSSNDNNGHLINEEGDNSSSGVSSDQENGGSSNGGGKFVTYLPVDGGAATSSIPPDNASESSDDVSEKSWILRAEQDPMGRSIISMKKMLHPKLQAIFDAPPVTSQHNKLMTSSAGPAALQSHFVQDYKSPYSTQTLPNRGHKKHATSNSQHSDERSIDQSLALIHQHVNSLSDPNAGSEDTAGSGIAVLAPPPGFSDSESFSDNESLSSSGSQRRFGIRGLPKTSRNLPMQSSLTDQLKKERMSAASASNNQNIMSRSMDSSHHLGGMSANFATLPRKQLQHQQQQQQQQMYLPTAQREFRTKPLIGWTVVDVCDWLDSLFMSEYKAAFIDHDVDGLKLAAMTKGELESLGVIRVGHTMNIERSLKRYLSPN